MTTGPPVGSPMAAQEVLDRDYLEIRAWILKLAASLDRIARSAPPAADAGKMAQIREGIQILLGQGADATVSDKAKQIQLLFSRPYSPEWPREMDVPVTKK